MVRNKRRSITLITIMPDIIGHKCFFKLDQNLESYKSFPIMMPCINRKIETL